MCIGAKDVSMLLTDDNWQFETRRTTSIGTEPLIKHIEQNVKLNYGELEEKVKRLPIQVSYFTLLFNT